MNENMIAIQNFMESYTLSPDRYPRDGYMRIQFTEKGKKQIHYYDVLNDIVFYSGEELRSHMKELNDGLPVYSLNSGKGAYRPFVVFEKVSENILGVMFFTVSYEKMKKYEYEPRIPKLATASCLFLVKDSKEAYELVSCIEGNKYYAVPLDGDDTGYTGNKLYYNGMASSHLHFHNSHMQGHTRSKKNLEILKEFIQPEFHESLNSSSPAWWENEYTMEYMYEKAWLPRSKKDYDLLDIPVKDLSEYKSGVDIYIQAYSYRTSSSLASAPRIIPYRNNSQIILEESGEYLIVRHLRTNDYKQSTDAIKYVSTEDINKALANINKVFKVPTTYNEWDWFEATRFVINKTTHKVTKFTHDWLTHTWVKLGNKSPYDYYLISKKDYDKILLAINETSLPKPCSWFLEVVEN